MISVFGSYFGELEKAYVSDCIESQWIGFGEKVKEFEESFCANLGFRDVVMVDSGSNALFLAIKLLNLPPNSEIILPSFTWISCANAVMLAGHTPVFADVDLETFNISAKTIEPHLNSKTGAILVVHYAGLPVEMKEILDFGYPTIEDCAHAVYSKLDGIPCGNYGDIAIFSFDAIKNLAVGEGGALVAKDPALLERARALRYCGIRKSGFEAAKGSLAEGQMWWEYELVEPFIKMLPTNIAGAIGLAQLERRIELQERRSQIWNTYMKALHGVGDLILPSRIPDNVSHSFFTFVIRTKYRDQLAGFLLSRGIYTTLRYEPLHTYPAFNSMNESLPNTEELARTSLSLPIHPRLTEDDVALILSTVVHFYKNL